MVWGTSTGRQNAQSMTVSHGWQHFGWSWVCFLCHHFFAVSCDWYLLFRSGLPSQKQASSGMWDCPWARKWHAALPAQLSGGKLDYCNGILHGISTMNINKLQRVQNTLARVVTGGRRYDHITPVLKELHWLPIKHRIDFNLAIIVYKVKQTQEPSYLAELLIDHKPNRNLWSNDCYLLERPRTRTVLATCTFSVAAPNIWNYLPNIIKTQYTIKEFKSKLKTHYFKSAFK